MRAAQARADCGSWELLVADQLHSAEPDISLPKDGLLACKDMSVFNFKTR